MILSDADIKQALLDKKIVITPIPDFSKQLGSCSIDLRLGHDFRIFEHSKYAFIDTRKPDAMHDASRSITIKDNEPFVIQPGDFALASTLESLELPDDLLARLEGRSSLGRMGIVVHSTASIFDPGWHGNLVLELGNLGRMPVALYAGMRICALTFEQLSSPSDVPYYKKSHAQYVGQKKP